MRLSGCGTSGLLTQTKSLHEKSDRYLRVSPITQDHWKRRNRIETQSKHYMCRQGNNEHDEELLALYFNGILHQFTKHAMPHNIQLSKE